jgi:hypothetical protein
MTDLRARYTRPPLLLRVYSFLTFPYSREGSLVWWWRMHDDTHGSDTDSVMGLTDDRDPNCPYCLTPEPTDD